MAKTIPTDRKITTIEIGRILAEMSPKDAASAAIDFLNSQNLNLTCKAAALPSLMEARRKVISGEWK